MKSVLQFDILLFNFKICRDIGVFGVKMIGRSSISLTKACSEKYVVVSLNYKQFKEAGKLSINFEWTPYDFK